jgi:hypothetical protein
MFRKNKKKICWLCMLITLIVGSVVWFLTSCKQNYEELKEIPPVVFREHPGSFGKSDIAYHFGHQRGYNSVTIETPRDVNVYMMDSRYKEVDYYWFRKYNNWFRKLLFENGIMSLGDGTENLDCDNFAMLYKSMSSVAAYKAKSKFEPCVALLVVRQVNEFGGVPGTGGLHMVNLVMTTRGWFVMEPQTGEFVLLEKYPNQQYLQLLLI